MKQPDFSGWTTIENLQTRDFRELPAGEDNSINPQFFRVSNLFGRVTYKPGTRIVVEYEKDRAQISVWIPTVDSNRMDDPYEGRFYLWAPYWLIEQQSDSELIKWLMSNITCFETHEVMEFFKVGGKRVREPHPHDPLAGEYMRDHARMYQLQAKVV